MRANTARVFIINQFYSMTIVLLLSFNLDTVEERIHFQKTMLNSLEEFALTKDLYLEVTDITQTYSVLRENTFSIEEEIADKYSCRIKECIRLKIPYILLV